MHLQNLFKIHLFILNNPKLDVVNINACAKSGQNSFIHTQDIERKMKFWHPSVAFSQNVANCHSKNANSLFAAPGRFAQKLVPPGTIRLGRFAQNFKRNCSHNITGTVRSKFNLLGQFTLFNFQNEKKIVLRLSFHLFEWIILIADAEYY